MAIETARLFRIPSVHVTPTERNAVLPLDVESIRLVRVALQSSKSHTPAGFADGRTTASRDSPVRQNNRDSSQGKTAIEQAARLPAIADRPMANATRIGNDQRRGS